MVGNIDSQSLSIIDLKKNQVQKTVALKTAPLGMVVHPSEDKILITSWYENKVIILSTKDFTITDKINVGITPSGIAFNKKHNYIIVANRDANTVEVYNDKNYKLFKKISVGKHPYGISSVSYTHLTLPTKA